MSLSSALGSEDLPGVEAHDLIAKWHESAVELGDPFLIWAATPLSEFDLDGLRNILTHERIVGLQLPATALGDPQAIIRLKPVLDVLQATDLPLLIHPGPVPIVHMPNRPTPVSATPSPTPCSPRTPKPY